ncbi:hypothetical protein BLNAU_19140 [Blattamonas nauphoetae]|uniref:Uncharacterized protein n=1 Tax=Blattamonas nauphoetae TaxID=2049346 RepID=A0ABQ9X2C4_9EUKA|nr:hypothetical protein BLNAU_25204 [Blattamonas nauphoetae]KAK2940263.1 hypothetical protein BLNAU_24833 [Blattamonas nauphoetae]KAK2940526.1 hypothetical protein BLNAU_24559 [Blattamonas nauphoetae]KAK2945486.1 hypothetical protein BLNAU_19559 [Blattamonas nauphoetae]KAK2945923.1 hypothetical protein BLNAU_19140 [Blattamonas nauphoetae]
MRFHHQPPHHQLPIQLIGERVCLRLPGRGGQRCNPALPPGFDPTLIQEPERADHSCSGYEDDREYHSTDAGQNPSQTRWSELGCDVLAVETSSRPSLHRCNIRVLTLDTEGINLLFTVIAVFNHAEVTPVALSNIKADHAAPASHTDLVIHHRSFRPRC